MATKLQFFQSVAEQAAKDVSAKRGNWTDFLDTAAKMYKYPFPDQLLIHAQRPDATACASAETWTTTFDRWNRRGSKGIALIDDTGSFPKLKYVFDVSDTYPLKHNARPVQLWEMRQEHREPVLDYLSGVYDDVGGTLADSFHNIASQLAREYYEDNAREIRYRAEDSFLEDFDDDNLAVAFEETLTNSIAYTLMSRCGLDTDEYFEDEDFKFIFDFNTPDMVYALGTASNELSEQVLRDIGLVIRKYERQHAAERSTENENRNNIHASRGLSSAGHQTERTAEGADRAVRQIRENEESVSERTPDNNIQFNASERNAVPAPSGNRGSGENEVRASNEPADREERTARQVERPDGLDGGDERLESASGGTGLERPDLRLNETPSRQIISEPDGVTDLYGALSQVGIRLTETISTSSIGLDEVDSILRDGGNSKNSILRIAAHFAKGMSPEENADFLRNEYLSGRWGHRAEPSGKGYQFGAQQIAVWFDENGIKIGRGKSALSSRDSALITWEQAAERVKALYDAGMYVSHDVLDEALYNESRERADDVIEVYQNLTRGISDIQYELKKGMDKEQKEALKDDWKNYRYLIRGLSELENAADEALNDENKVSSDELMRLYNETISLSEELPPEWNFKATHPEIDEHMTELLRDMSENGGYNQILARLKKDVAALNETPDAPIRFWRNPYRALNNLEKAGLSAHGFPVVDYQSVNFMRFITDDEVDRFLTRGGTYTEGKLRIMSHFLNNHTPQERVSFLKDQYGHGGGTWFDGWSNAEPGKGINLKRSGCEDVNLNWNQAVRRTEAIIKNGRYISRSDLEKIPDYERLMLARQVNNFYYNLPPEEYESPFAKELDFNYPREDEWEAINNFLGDTEQIDGVLAQMQYIFVNTPEEDKYYDVRSAGFHNLVAFREGTYTLFPGVENLPDPEFTDKTILSEIKGQRNAPAVSKPSIADGQLTLFDYDIDPPPKLPNPEEQKAIIEKASEPTAEANAPAVSLLITQDEVDALFLTVSDEDKMRLAAGFADNPRSKETVRLVREIYGGIEETLPRLDGENGYLGILGESTGVAIVRGASAAIPLSERPPAETLTLPWAAVIKRVGELANDGRLAVTEQRQDLTAFNDCQKLKAENPGCVVFYQIGETFEFYQDDAVIASQMFGVPLIPRNTGTRDYHNAAVIAFDRIGDAVDEVYKAGYGLVISSLNTDGSHSVMRIPHEDEPAAEKTVEAETAELTAQVYYSPKNNVPYREGDAVEGLIAHSMNFFVITKIDNDYVYCNFLHSTQEPLATRRNVFDIYLDEGQIQITEADTERTTDNSIESNSMPQAETEPIYNIGDRLEYNSKPHEIEQIGEYVRLKNLGTPSAYPIFDYVSVPKQNFDRMLSDGEIAITAIQDTQLSSTAEQPAPELDFDTVAQTVFERVMQDTEFTSALNEAQGRGALRRPLNTALEIAVYEHQEDEPQVYQAFISDDDFNDRLFDYVYRQSWEARQQREAEAVTQTEDTPKPTAERLLSQDGTDFYLFHFPVPGDTPAALSHETLSLITERADKYIICADVCYLSEEDMTKFGIEFRKMPRDLELLPEAVREKIHAINPGHLEELIREDLSLRGFAVDEDLITSGLMDYQAHGGRGNVQDIADFIENEYLNDEPDQTLEPETEQSVSKPLMTTPPPVFFVDWETSQFDFDLTLYSDHDIIGYNKNGVEYALGRSGNLTYVTSTGMLWGGNEVPGNIYEQINAYNNGELSDEQVRQNYLKVLEAFKNAKTGEVETADNPDAPTSRPAVPGDTVYYRNKPYTIDSIGDFDVKLYDPSIAFPVKMSLFIREFDEILTRDPRNAHLLPIQQETPSQQNEQPQESASPRPSVIVEQILSPGAEVNQIYADFEAIKNGHAKHDTIAIESYNERHTANGIDALLLRDLLANVDDPRFTTGGAFYERERSGADFPHFVIYDLELARQKIAEAGYLLKIDGKIEMPVDRQTVISAGANFRITDDHLGEGGAKTKFRNNINAINTLKNIELEKRSATPEEQEILSRYIGWGGLPQAFDPDNKQWENEYLELNAALLPEEFESARASTLNAHYTSPTVIKAIYEAVERMGFKTGNILEPSCGVGNFFGLLPDSMRQSKLYGVEIDSVTARIAKQLYPKANIKEMGFEKTDTPDAFFDLAIGNVPFGNYPVVDKRYDKHKFAIHDYFFAKTLDQVRPGGVIAFITSKFTLDKQNPDIRKYIAQRAELLGAVRMPNDAFLKNAGTETTMDIIFLKKRDRPMDIEPDWVHLGMTEDGLPVNRYFLDNPEMLLGKMALDERMNNKYGRNDVTACLPIEGADLAEQLKTALLNIQGTYTVEELDDIEGIDNHAIPADPNVKNFSYTVVDDTVYFRENSLMYPVELPATTLERIKGMITLRDCVQELIALQMDDYGEDAIKTKQAELNMLYDNFSAEYGLINSQGNRRAFDADNAYYLLCSLEILNEDNEFERKADMFSKRTIKQRVEITHVDTATEALAVSLGEKARVDIEYMAELTGFTTDKLIQDLEGVIFFDFGNPNRSLPAFDPEKMKLYEKFPLVTADEYLSGNVRDKLAKAVSFNEAAGDEFHGANTAVNVTALEAAQPKDLTASEIAVRLGSTWIAPEYVQQFMYELLNTSWRNRDIYQVKYHQYTGEWQVTGKNKSIFSDIHATVTYGTERMNAYQIIDDTLNLRDVRVYDYKTDADGKEKRELNKNETTKAQQRQEQIKQAFKDWIWKDPERRQTLVKLYNERFNSLRPREFDGSHITFSGISPEITMRPHQLNAIAHILYGNNTLLAHVVGAGKTFEMVGAAMESKRLGLCHKSLFAVPNHLTEQWAGEFLRLYPSANILVAKKKDFEMRNRKKFCAKIATGSYDAVIIGHSQLEKIPISRERQERHINEQLWEIEQGIEELKNTNGERYSIKQLEKTKKSLEARLVKLLDAKKRDDVVTFEQLGVDRLFVDEAHSFKNLFLYTKMRNVAGLSTSEAAKSSDLFMKCQYMDEVTEKNHGRPCGTIFATGTPISNSMTEMYTMQRYLQFNTLSAKGLTHFDSWASIFGETQTSIELAPEGTGYRARTRFAKFYNLPELMSMFKDVADIQTADMLKLPVPDAKFENIIVEPSDVQKEMVQDLSKRAAAVHSGRIDPRIDNMLKITTDGRKIGLDQRLINPLLDDFEGSKINACTEKIYQIWEETKSDRLTQLVFSDFSTPNKDGRFNIYDDIRAKLIERGIPEHELAFIHDADTETKKKELFAKVRQGKVRILLGSTFKMGAGTNVQDRLVATHDVDCPWRPADLEQRAGRIIRQGNQNNEVQIFRYATSGTFDSYLWQTVENKQKFIAQIMSSKSPVRSCEDVDETALSYAEIKALCAGNPLIAEKMNLDVEVAKLRMLKADHQSQHYRLEDDLLKRYPEQIKSVTERIAGIEKDIAAYAVQNEKTLQLQTGLDGSVSAAAVFAGMTINGVEYKEKEPAAKALLESCKGVKDKTENVVGEYMGFKMSLRMEGMTLDKKFQLLLRGSMTYQTELGTDAFGNITRINNVLNELPKRLEGAKSQLENLLVQQEAAKQELEKPFALIDELAEKEMRLALLNAELNIEGGGGLDVMNDPDNRSEAAKEQDEDFYDDEDGEFDEIDGDDDMEYNYQSQPERQVAYAKAKPPMLETIRAYNADKKPPIPGKKSNEQEL